MGIFGFLRRNIFTFGNKRPRRLAYLVGCYTIGYQVYDMTYASVMHNAREPVALRERYGNGSWVVISGASDPVGRAFALRFLQNGFHVYLLGQDALALSTAVGDLRKEVGEEAQITMRAFDYEKADDWK